MLNNYFWYMLFIGFCVIFYVIDVYLNKILDRGVDLQISRIYDRYLLAYISCTVLSYIVSILFAIMRSST